MDKKQQILGNFIRQNNHLSEQQLQIVYGGLLGDSNINVRANGACRLKMGHSSKQLDYLEFKKKMLEPFVIQEKPTIDFQPNNKYSPNFTFYSYNTIVHQDFTDIFGLFYRNIEGKRKKYITMNFLNNLQPLAIFIWFLDDGCYNYSKNKTHKIYLSTYRYSLSEHQTLKEWFWKKWKIESKITFDTTHQQYYLRFNIDGLRLFDDLFLKPFHQNVPSCMNYKFPNF